MKAHRLVIMLTLPAAVVAGAPYGVAGQNAETKVAVAKNSSCPMEPRRPVRRHRRSDLQLPALDHGVSRNPRRRLLV